MIFGIVVRFGSCITHPSSSNKQLAKWRLSGQCVTLFNFYYRISNNWNCTKKKYKDSTHGFIIFKFIEDK